jgi:two-component system OmpR family sensor kinase
MVTKGDLGTTYLVSVGVVLFATLSTGATIPHVVSGVSVGYHSLPPLVAGLMIAVVYTATGLWLREIDLDDEKIWRVSTWAAVGLGIPTMVFFVLYLWGPQLLSTLDWRTLATTTIAFGGIVGILSGALFGLRTEYERKQTLYQRNTVLLRLFRHDIRNSVNLIRGHVDLMNERLDLPTESTAVIDDQLDHVLRLGAAARKLEDIESMETTQPIDVSALVRDALEQAREKNPAVTFEADIRPNTVAVGNDVLETAVANLLDNPVAHHDEAATVEVSIGLADTDDDLVELSIRDDGPGFPDNELAVHTNETETPLQHSDGVGLWLSRWIVEALDGDFSIQNGPQGGALVTIRLPAAAGSG